MGDRNAALPFCDTLRPALGFTDRDFGQSWKVTSTTEAARSKAYFTIIESAEHVHSANRIAFWVESRDEVDRSRRMEGPETVAWEPAY